MLFLSLAIVTDIHITYAALLSRLLTDETNNKI